MFHSRCSGYYCNVSLLNGRLVEGILLGMVKGKVNREVLKKVAQDQIMALNQDKEEPIGIEKICSATSGLTKKRFCLNERSPKSL